MNLSKIIKGVVGGGRYTVTAPIIKEDYGLYLQIEGIELPDTYEVDFSNDEHNGTSVTMIGNADGVLIPSQFISSGKDVFAFLYYVGEDYGRTIYKFRIPNKLRPDRTDEEPTPEEQSVIDQTISALNDAVESVQDAQQAIEDMSVSAQTLAEGSSATVTKSEQEGVVHLEFGIPIGATGSKGDKGDTGADGISPTVTITPITGGHRITITDADGSHSADVMDGTGNVDDVQINGTSIVQDGVANVPIASASSVGVARIGGGLNKSNDAISLFFTSETFYKSANQANAVIINKQHLATFYGLAKAAGADEKNSTLPVGQYTEDAKIAIQKMLGIYEAPWELIREDTFTNVEEADHIIDVDANGEAFELIDALVIFALPKQNSYAKKGAYGQVSYFHDSTEILRTEHGAWEQQANANPRGFISAIENHNGMIFARQSNQTVLGYTTTESIRFPQNLILGQQSSFAFTGNVTINNINIKAVTGTGRYKLYGRRKWQ